MNFIAATVELRSFVSDPINAYGLDYRGADAVVPAASSAGEVQFRLLCYDRAGAKLSAFEGWKPGTRALITGNIVFSDDTSKPLDLIITTIETNIPEKMYCNQVVLGNAFFASNEIKERKNSQVAVKIGTPKDKIETKEAQPYWKPSSLADGESEEFRLLGCYETGHAIVGWQYASEKRGSDGELKFNGYVVTRTHPGQPEDLLVKLIGLNQTGQRLMAHIASLVGSLLGLLPPQHAADLKFLFIEQKSLREQLTEVLQEIEDYTWTEEGLANFSIKITRKGQGLETSYSILPKVRKVPDKICKEWESNRDSIWLPNFFEGKDPFAGRQVDAKGLPAAGVDKRGSTVLPKTASKQVDDDNEF
jgi:hypothetical protein